MKQVPEEIKQAIINYSGSITHYPAGKARAKPTYRPDAADSFLQQKKQKPIYKSDRIEHLKNLTYKEKITLLHKRYLASEWAGKMIFWKWRKRRNRLKSRNRRKLMQKRNQNIKHHNDHNGNQ